MSHEYKFYIQRVEFDANSGSYIPIDSTTIDLENHYAGLKYSKLTGTNDKGKTKNIYTEKYADGDRLRVYIPELAQYEATTMTLTLYFFGEDRQQVFNEFANEIKTGIHRYWDTARHQYFDFFVENINAVFGSSFALRNILLPLGISFFTFQQISFLADTFVSSGRKNTARLIAPAPNFSLMASMAFSAFSCFS